MKAKLLILCFSIASLFLSDKLNAQDLYFTPDIINILDDNNCLGCHGSSGGLNLNTYAQALAGGNNCGPAFIPFDAENSSLITKIDPSVPTCAGGAMPPSGSVSADDIASIRLWIEQGALESAPVVCEDLLISAYVEGSSQNKCIELFNGTENDIDLATYSIDVYSNGNTEANSSFTLEGTIAAGGYFLVCHAEADLAGITVDFAANLNYNGNDAVALNNGMMNIDVIGEIGVNPEEEAWINGDCSTANNTLIKMSDDSLCGFGSADGTGDFSAALGNLYNCFPSNDVTQLNSFSEPILCPTLTLPDDVEAEITVCAGEEVFLDVVVTETTADNVLWSDGSTGTSISTGILVSDCEGTTLTFTASVAGGTVDGCEDEVSVTYTVIVLPDLTVGAELNIDDESCTISITNFCEAASITFTVNDGEVQAGSSYTAMAGEMSDVNFFIGDDICDNTATFSSAISCPDVVEPCAELSAVSETTVTICSNESIDLSVAVANGDVSMVSWSNGEMGATASYVASQVTDCDGFTDILTATYVDNTGGECPETITVDFMIMVLPNPNDVVSLEVNTASCAINLLNACDDFEVSYIVDGGEAQTGTTYQALASSFHEVVFIATSSCGTATLDAILDCETVPIELLGNINGYVLETGNLLKWATASEYNNAFFTLSSSIDGKNFETIAKKTGAGTSNLTKNYEFLDSNAKAGTTYYQLTQTDFDGTSKDLGIINLRRENNHIGNLNVYPIPSSDVVNLNFDSAISQEVTIKIYDLTGKLVAEKAATTIVGNNVLPLNIDTYIAGTYFVTINNENINMSAKFVKY
ncbi:MAG: T9SS type A sorting domain-containing protein [Chitinophagales bacterium]